MINFNLPSVWYKALDFVDYNYELGGWHRIAIVSGIGLLLYCGVISWLYWGDKKK